MKIAGLDIGTTGCKFTVFDCQGNYIDRAYRDYPVSRDRMGHEIDPVGMMQSVYAVITEMADKYSDILGFGVTSFGESFVCVDENGAPLHNIILYTDPRGGDEARELTEKLGTDYIVNTTGTAPHEMYGICKMMWIMKHRPDVYCKTKYILPITSYAVYCLTGVAQVDYSLACRIMALNISTLDWDDRIIEASGIDRKLLAKTVPSGTKAGTVTEATARITGLSPETVVVTLGHDQIAAAIGSGTFKSDMAVDGAGTVECLTPIFDGIPDMKIMSKGNFAVVPYVIPGKYVAYAFQYTGGALNQWITSKLAKKEDEDARLIGKSVYRTLEAEYDRKFGLSEPTGLLVLPHFAGAATPYMDTGSRGAILGLTLDTDVCELYMACMEGVTYEMLLNIEAMKGSGIHFMSLNATGGGAKSAVWMQMKADVLNMPITALEVSDAGTVGSAMMTGLAVGIFESLEDAASCMVKRSKTYYPRKDMNEKYMQIYEKYREVYKAVRGLM